MTRAEIIAKAKLGAERAAKGASVRPLSEKYVTRLAELKQQAERDKKRTEKKPVDAQRFSS